MLINIFQIFLEIYISCLQSLYTHLVVRFLNLLVLTPFPTLHYHRGFSILTKTFEFFFLQILACVMLTLAKIHLYPTWKPQTDTNNNELEHLLHSTSKLYESSIFCLSFVTTRFTWIQFSLSFMFEHFKLGQHIISNVLSFLAKKHG